MSQVVCLGCGLSFGFIAAINSDPIVDDEKTITEQLQLPGLAG